MRRTLEVFSRLPGLAGTCMLPKFPGAGGRLQGAGGPRGPRWGMRDPSVRPAHDLGQTRSYGAKATLLLYNSRLLAEVPRKNLNHQGHEGFTKHRFTRRNDVRASLHDGSGTERDEYTRAKLLVEHSPNANDRPGAGIARGGGCGRYRRGLHRAFGRPDAGEEGRQGRRARRGDDWLGREFAQWRHGAHRDEAGRQQAGLDVWTRADTKDVCGFAGVD